MNRNKFIWLTFLTFFLFAACQPSRNNNSQVVLHELSDPDMLNPINYLSGEAGNIMSNMYSGLLSVDYQSLELIPVLASARPEIEQRTDGKGLLITYNIRPEASFDNGDPVLAKDFEFTLKVIFNPFVNCPRMRGGFSLIEDVRLYPDNPRKITFVCNEVYFLAEAQTGDLPVIPPSVYDPKGILNAYSLKDLISKGDSLRQDQKLIEFAEHFNSSKFQRDSAFVQGTGAYALSNWVTGQRVTLIRKENWWGDKVKDKLVYFEAYPAKLIYEIINDQTTALVALKSGQIDLMRGIKAKDYVELNKSEKFKGNYHLFAPTLLQYSYLGINTKLPKFSDVKVRMALSHLLDAPTIIKSVFYDLGVPVKSPVHPSKSESYNNDIVPFEYNVSKAQLLLNEAGWKDLNGDGTLDKMIDGKKEELTIQFLVNAGNDERKAVALLFAEEARKVGVKVDVVALERSVYGERQRSHNFEMYYGSWSSPPVPDDFTQLFHTNSYQGGSNYCGFGDAQSDALIDSMRVEMNEKKRNEMSKRFQKKMHESACYIFLQAAKEKLAIHKRFTNTLSTAMRPGYREASFLEPVQ